MHEVTSEALINTYQLSLNNWHDVLRHRECAANK